MSHQALEKHRRALEAERERLLSDRAKLRQHAEEGLSGESSEISDYDTNHPADFGTETFEREKAMALDENLDGLLAQVATAMSKLEDGSYGTCDACGESISGPRLDALPHAIYCIDCQARIEQQ